MDFWFICRQTVIKLYVSYKYENIKDSVQLLIGSNPIQTQMNITIIRIILIKTVGFDYTKAYVRIILCI